MQKRPRVPAGVLSERDPSAVGMAVVIAQGMDRGGARATRRRALTSVCYMLGGWLRANDRPMTLTIVLRGLVADARRRWMDALAGSGCLQFEIALRHEDGTTIDPSTYHQSTVERCRVIGDTYIMSLPTHTLTVDGRNGAWRALQSPEEISAVDCFKWSTQSNEIRIRLRICTNVTSRRHNGRTFRFIASARCGDDLLTARSASFELLAKPPVPPSAPTPELGAAAVLPITSPPLVVPEAVMIPKPHRVRNVGATRVRNGMHETYVQWRPSWVPTADARLAKKRPRPSILTAPPDLETSVRPQCAHIEDFFA